MSEKKEGNRTLEDGRRGKRNKNTGGKHETEERKKDGEEMSDKKGRNRT